MELQENADGQEISLNSTLCHAVSEGNKNLLAFIYSYLGFFFKTLPRMSEIVVQDCCGFSGALDLCG